MSKKKRRKPSQLWSYGWWESPTISRQQLLEHLEPLLERLRRVDAIVLKILSGKGYVRDAVDLGTLLGEPFSIGDSTAKTLRLTDFAAVRTQLSSLSSDLHFEVHAVQGRYPSYFLCRVSTGWEEPDVILEDLYVSPTGTDYSGDRHFTILMRNGRSRTFLRLSTFREILIRWLTAECGKAPDCETCDDILETIATLVLAAAWYEDQQLPFHTADVFGLKQFRTALEMVGFVLGSDLYQVAARIREEPNHVIGFFTHVHPSPALATVLKKMEHATAAKLGELESRCRDMFVQLNQAFSAFLSTCGCLRNLEHLELYKIVLGCYAHLQEVASDKHWTTELQKAVQDLEACSMDVVQAILRA